MSDKAKDSIYSGIKKILRSPSLSSSSHAGRRSSSGSFSLSGALSSFSLSRSVSTSSTNDRNSNASTTSTTSIRFNDAELSAALSAAAAAAADELYANEKPTSIKKERRPSFSFATWKDKHRAKKHAQQAQKDAEKVAVAYGATAATPKAAGTHKYSRSLSSSSSSSTTTPRSLSHSYSHSHSSGSSHDHVNNENNSNSHNRAGVGSSGRQTAYNNTTATSAIASQANQNGRSRSNTSGTASANANAPSAAASAARLARDNSVRSRAASSVMGPPARPPSSSSSYSFSARREEKSRTTNRASTMIVDDMTTIVKPRRTNRSRPVAGSSAWDDSDTDEDGDSYEDSSAPRPRGLSRRSVSMDFMEPQQPTHLISKIWRKLPIQARLYGRGSIDLDMEKDRTSISRSSATKQLQRGNSSSNTSDEYSIPSSPLPDESNLFGDKHIRFSHQVSFSPPEDEEYIALESYDDALVRVGQFGAHDQRKTSVKVQEFLERSISFMRGTTTKRGLKVSISNEEIRMWRRLARHDWQTEEITQLPLSTATTNSSKTTTDSTTTSFRRNHAASRSQSCSSVTEEEMTDEDDAVVSPAMEMLVALCQVANFCLNTGDTLFTCTDIEELVTLELLVEEDGWI